LELIHTIGRGGILAVGVDGVASLLILCCFCFCFCFCCCCCCCQALNAAKMKDVLAEVSLKRIDGVASLLMLCYFCCCWCCAAAASAGAAAAAAAAVFQALNAGEMNVGLAEVSLQLGLSLWQLANLVLLLLLLLLLLLPGAERVQDEGRAG
jgi:hypothetical protein